MRPAAFDAELLARVAAVPREELLDLVRDLERARDAALLRLVQTPASRLLTLEEAAAIVRLPQRRLRSLARGKPWVRYLGRSLRVDEAGFTEWARCSGRVTNPHERSVSGPADVSGAHETVTNGRGPHLRRVRG